MEKSELFDAIKQDGSLPRKTFSMGHASDKRYYMEARKIRWMRGQNKLLQIFFEKLQQFVFIFFHNNIDKKHQIL